MKAVYISICAIAWAQYGFAQGLDTTPVSDVKNLVDEELIEAIYRDDNRHLIAPREEERDLGNSQGNGRKKGKKGKKGKGKRPTAPASDPTSLRRKYKAQSTQCAKLRRKRFACKRSRICRFTKGGCVPIMQKPRSRRDTDVLGTMCKKTSKRRRCRTTRKCSGKRKCIRRFSFSINEDEDDDDQGGDEDQDEDGDGDGGYYYYYGDGNEDHQGDQGGNDDHQGDQNQDGNSQG
mmetsp:Transcript_10313/g.16829  ORF Transcript_10313/g.16829 Transcript_10313/m.16829 type:complete len:234 (+) Transcript_10313:256-957(+)